MNYQEWQHSDFNAEERSCQSCHMPTVAGPVRDRRRCSATRATSLARHVFVGGNAFMLRLLNRYRTELGVDGAAGGARSHGAGHRPSAAAGHGDARRRRAPRLDGGTLAFDVDVRNLTGHKFPTGYPSRRTWLHVTVRDAQRRRRCSNRARSREPARFDGNDNDADPRRSSRTTSEITSADQVQIYESILGDRAGAPTTGLLTATQYLKDNRLLPRGFDKATAAAGDRRVRRGRGRCRLHRRRRSRALPGRRVRRRARIASTSSCATSRSATAGRTTSSATTRPSRRRFVSYYKADVGGLVRRRRDSRKPLHRERTPEDDHDPESRRAASAGRSLHDRARDRRRRRSGWCRCSASRRLRAPRPRRCCCWPPRRRLRVGCNRARRRTGRSSACPARVPPVQEHEEWGERTQTCLLVLGVIELAAWRCAIAEGEAGARRRRGRRRWSASCCVYETGEHGGELVYSYAGGVGMRTGDEKDVERLLLAGYYHQAMADRKAGRSDSAAQSDLGRGESLSSDDPEVQMLAAESLLLDQKNPQGAHRCARKSDTASRQSLHGVSARHSSGRRV